jgi:hypothetical protein
MKLKVKKNYETVSLNLFDLRLILAKISGWN